MYLHPTDIMMWTMICIYKYSPIIMLKHRAGSVVIGVSLSHASTWHLPLFMGFYMPPVEVLLVHLNNCCQI